MVEFALVAPLTFLILLGIPVLAVLTMGQIELNNSVRDSVRAAAICGSDSSTTQTIPNTTPPTACTKTNTLNYITNRFAHLQGASNQATIVSIKVYDKSHSLQGTGDPSLCQLGWTVEIDASYTQPLYVPLVGYALGNGSTNTRSLSESAEATCEQ